MNFLICARGGSKGIKYKNLKKINGKSLVERSILFAKKFNNNIFLSTDSKKIFNVGKKNRIKIVSRPKSLAKDNTGEILVWKHYANWMKKKKFQNNFFVSLPPTSPLRTLATVKKSIKTFKKGNYDIVVVITKSRRSPYFNILKKKKDYVEVFENKIKYVRRQDVPKTYDLTTIAYVVKTKFLERNKIKSIFDGKVGFVETENIIETLDIDNNYDLKLAKIFLNK